MRPSLATYGQRGPGALPRCAALELEFRQGIRVPEPNSSLATKAGWTPRGCKSGTGLPSARQLSGAKARGLGGARGQGGAGTSNSPTPYFCLLVGIQRAMATTSPRGAGGFSHSCSERR